MVAGILSPGKTEMAAEFRGLVDSGRGPGSDQGVATGAGLARSSQTRSQPSRRAVSRLTEPSSRYVPF